MTTSIQYTTDIETVVWSEMVTLFERAPLGKLRKSEELERAFHNSQLKLFAYDGNRLVGTGRVLSDGVWRAVIYDVAVLPEYRGKGIGSTLIRELVERAGVDIIMLFAAPGKEQFYERFGFRKMKTAMAIMANPEERRARGFIE